MCFACLRRNAPVPHAGQSSACATRPTRFRRVCLHAALLVCALLLGLSGLSAQAAPAAADEPLPFGSNLFQGHFSQSSAGDLVAPGNRLVVRLWGTRTLDEVLTVGTDGALDMPQLGPLHVAGLNQEQMEKALRSKLQAAGAEGVEFYIAPLDQRSVSVIVTGYVPRPGKYQGTAADTVLAFLDRAGGIDPARGSYRQIRLMRQGKEVVSVDLYPFVLNGVLPQVLLQDGDTIVVGEKGPTVSAAGEVRNSARFELRPNELYGTILADLADAQPRASHVNLVGSRQGVPYKSYLPLEEFRNLRLEHGDKIQFLADTQSDTIMVEVRGAIRGASRFPVKRTARLYDVQQFIAVDPNRANLEGLHIKRKSVAVRQKQAIEEALRRLEQNAYTATSASPDEAQIRGKEAEMISTFVTKARETQPDGVVVVGAGGKLADLALEDGDVIVIPEKSDVVLVSGEVMMPQAIVWSKEKQLDDYVNGSGGFTSRADSSNLLVVRPSGEVVPKAATIQPGDQLLVLPKVDSKGMQGLKDVSQVLYQIAVACKVVVDLTIL